MPISCCFSQPAWLVANAVEMETQPQNRRKSGYCMQNVLAAFPRGRTMIMSPGVVARTSRKGVGRMDPAQHRQEENFGS